MNSLLLHDEGIHVVLGESLLGDRLQINLDSDDDFRNILFCMKIIRIKFISRAIWSAKEDLPSRTGIKNETPRQENCRRILAKVLNSRNDPRNRGKVKDIFTLRPAPSR